MAISRCPTSSAAGDEKEVSLLSAAGSGTTAGGGSGTTAGGGSGTTAGGGFDQDDGVEEAGTHVYKADPRNKDILILVRDGVDGSSSLV